MIQFWKRRMPVKNGYIACRHCQRARFLDALLGKSWNETTCWRHRPRKVES